MIDPAEKSRLRSEESVFDCKDKTMRASKHFDWHYKTTKSVLKNSKLAFASSSFDDFLKESRDGSADSSTTSSTSSIEFFHVYPRVDDECDDSNSLRMTEQDEKNSV